MNIELTNIEYALDFGDDRNFFVDEMNIFYLLRWIHTTLLDSMNNTVRCKIADYMNYKLIIKYTDLSDPKEEKSWLIQESWEEWSEIIMKWFNDSYKLHNLIIHKFNLISYMDSEYLASILTCCLNNVR
jgi:hypothetical protein